MKLTASNKFIGCFYSMLTFVGLFKTNIETIF